MISRHELRELADFECRRSGEVAVTFYFHPAKPKDKSHREEAIQAKDLVRKTIQELAGSGRNRNAIDDLNKISSLAERLHGNGSLAKAVFACGGREFWREFDLPPGVSGTALLVNRRFHLKPLASLFSENPRLWVAVVDRQKARFLEVELGVARGQGKLANPVPRHGRSDGYAGYDGGRAQRHSQDEVRRHFRAVADYLKSAVERAQFEALVIGCHDVNWPMFEDQLHSDVRRRMMGRFSGDLAALTDEKAVEESARILRDSLQQHHHRLLRETLDEARGNGRAVTGLRRVLRATEQGEADTILMSRDYSARAVECGNCRHLDSHLVRYCPVCGRTTRQLDDVCEALVPIAIRNNIGLVLVDSDEDLDHVGNIAALLRFRADRNTNQMLAAS